MSGGSSPDVECLPRPQSEDLRGDGPGPLHQQKSVDQSEIPPLSLRLSFIPIHTRAFMHAHSHTVSSMSAASQQQVSEDRGHLCSGLPLLSSSASGHLCWGKTGREERADSLPLSSHFHTTKTQNSFNGNASALAS